MFMHFKELRNMVTYSIKKAVDFNVSATNRMYDFRQIIKLLQTQFYHL